MIENGERLSTTTMKYHEIPPLREVPCLRWLWQSLLQLLRHARSKACTTHVILAGYLWLNRNSVQFSCTTLAPGLKIGVV